MSLGLLPALEVLVLTGTRVRAAAAAQLQAVNPHLEVVGVPMPSAL